MLHLIATYPGDNVVCSKANNCTFIRTIQRTFDDNDDIRYYTSEDMGHVYSNIVDREIATDTQSARFRVKKLELVTHPRAPRSERSFLVPKKLRSYSF